MSTKKRPLIGIIGGAGPFASLDIEKKILQQVRQSAWPALDKDYPNLLIYQYTNFSEIDADIRRNQYIQCTKLLDAASVDFMIIACHSAHAYLPSLREIVKCEILDLVQETAKYFSTTYPEIKKVGLISAEGTLKANLYQDALAYYDIEVLVPTEVNRRKVIEGIYLLKAGITERLDVCYVGSLQQKHSFAEKIPSMSQGLLPDPLSFVHTAIQELSNMGCEYIILGCTEMPLLLPRLNSLNPALNIIDPNLIIAKVIVKLYEQ